MNQFIEQDKKDISHWFDVVPQMAIQGLLAERNQQQRVYIVTEPPPGNLAWIHDRWPRLVKLAPTQFD